MQLSTLMKSLHPTSTPERCDVGQIHTTFLLFQEYRAVLEELREQESEQAQFIFVPNYLHYSVDICESVFFLDANLRFLKRILRGQSKIQLLHDFSSVPTLIDFVVKTMEWTNATIVYLSLEPSSSFSASP